MRRLVLETIREFGMIEAGQVVAAGCSGGADSTALVLVLKELASPLGFLLSVAHLNHCLRGSESEADEKFVRSLAERLEVPCFVERTDVGRVSRHAKANLESKARELRLRFFESLIESGKTDMVALGHTADDQAETVLQRLLRGAGTRGLGGIHPAIKSPSGKLNLIRPMIRARRSSIREWLAERG
jgi:tRNA(Ile)-lysidine synthase